MWAATVAKDLIVLELPIDLRTSRMQWRRKTHEVDPIFDGNKAQFVVDYYVAFDILFPYIIVAFLYIEVLCCCLKKGTIETITS